MIYLLLSVAWFLFLLSYSKKQAARLKSPKSDLASYVQRTAEVANADLYGNFRHFTNIQQRSSLAIPSSMDSAAVEYGLTSKSRNAESIFTSFDRLQPVTYSVKKEETPDNIVAFERRKVLQ